MITEGDAVDCVEALRTKLPSWIRAPALQTLSRPNEILGAEVRAVSTGHTLREDLEGDCRGKEKCGTCGG